MLFFLWARLVNVTLIVVILLFFLIKFALADVYLEPYLGYAVSGTVTKKLSTVGPVNEWSYRNPGGGFRLGIDYIGAIVGLEYSMIKMEWEGVPPINSNINDQKQSIDGKYLGAFLGFIFPLGVIVHGTLFGLSSMKKLDDNGPYANGDTYQGMGFSLGIGYKFMPLLAANLEYRDFNMDKVKIAANNGTEKLNGDLDLSVSELFFSISIPLVF